MATTLTALRRQIASAGDLKSVVRTMKASAASAIGQYERSVAALADYANTVELGLSVCLRSATVENSPVPLLKLQHDIVRHIVILGSDQGLVGRFNESVVQHAISELTKEKSTLITTKVWVIGERAHARLIDAGITPEGCFSLSNSVERITRLVGEILLKVEQPEGTNMAETQSTVLTLFYNRPVCSGYQPISQQVLPLDENWRSGLTNQAWPTTQLPEVLGNSTQTLCAFLREHLFVSLFRACAESLASENACRLAAMQRADRNIGELLEQLQSRFHQLRQSGIDEELFDVISGFDALSADDVL